MSYIYPKLILRCTVTLLSKTMKFTRERTAVITKINIEHYEDGKPTTHNIPTTTVRLKTMNLLLSIIAIYARLGPKFSLM